MRNRIAVLYDFMQVKGGAESVTLDLCRHFDDVTLISSWVNRDCFPNLGNIEQQASFLTTPTKLLGWQTIKSANTFLYKTPDLTNYQSAIFSGSNAPLAILKTKAQKNIYYCHTPPRFIYDLQDYYLDSIRWWQKPALKSLINWLKPQYEEALYSMDALYCNSVNIQERLKTFLNVEAKVIYPPVDIDRFSYISDGNYFVSTARLEPYKRVEVIVKAFMEQPDKKLVVTSGGSQEDYLRNLAKGYDNITFTGWTSESELANIIGKSLATIYIPIDEDFGMSPVESMGAGKPVIGVSEGGLKETITDGKTGWLLNGDNIANELSECIDKVNHESAREMREYCEIKASKFSKKAFLSEIEGAIYN